MYAANSSLCAPRQIPGEKLLSAAMATVCLLVILALTSGCGLLRAPQRVVTAVVPGGQSKQEDPLTLQIQLQRYADEFGAQTSAAIDEYAMRVGTESARVEALKWKLGALSGSVMIASGPHPKGNLLDMAAMATLTRLTIEDPTAAPTNTAAAESWLRTARLLETNIWKIANASLEPSQVEELRTAILEWHERHPDATDAFFARPQALAALMKVTPQHGAKVASVFDLVNLDPTTGLDPAVREVTLTRLFAERAMYTMQRMPFLLRLQASLLTEQISEQPSVKTMITNTARISESADRISRSLELASTTVAQLPDRISEERKEVLAALNQQEGKLKELAAQVSLTLESGEKMSTSLNTTITTFDGLMKRFGVGEPSTDSTPDTNSPPFNILDYGQVAQQVAAMAKELNGLINSVDQSMPQVQRLSQTATVDAQKLVDHGFRLGLVLIAVLLLGAVLSGLTYRFFAARMTRPIHTPTPIEAPRELRP